MAGLINPEVKNVDDATATTAAATTGARTDYDGDGVNDNFPLRPRESTMDFSQGDFSVTPSDFGPVGSGYGMLVNPMMQFAIQPNASA